MPSRSSGGERLRSVQTQRFVRPKGMTDDLEPGSLAGVHGASVAGPPVHEATRGAATAIPEDVTVTADLRITALAQGADERREQPAVLDDLDALRTRLSHRRYDENRRKP